VAYTNEANETMLFTAQIAWLGNGPPTGSNRSCQQLNWSCQQL